MRRIYLSFLGFTALILSFVSPGRAQDKPASGDAATSAPTAGPRAEFLEEIAYYEQRYTRFAEAMPAEKYSWRPGRRSSLGGGSLHPHHGRELRDRAGAGDGVSRGLRL
jgi:hypothetical protein